MEHSRTPYVAGSQMTERAHSSGRRSWMRHRLLTCGPESLTDPELLEMLLFLGIERNDTRSLAEDLLGAFGTLGKVLKACPAEVAARQGLPQRGLLALSLARPVLERLKREDAASRPLLSSLQQVEAYLRQRSVTEGSTLALFLNNRNYLLDEEAADLASGQKRRLILRRALALHATAVLVVDVSDDQPSLAAAEDAARLARAASLVSILLHDRLQLRSGDLYSYRGGNLLMSGRHTQRPEA